MHRLQCCPVGRMLESRACVSYKGTVKNGVVVLPPDAKLPEGATVDVTPLEAPLVEPVRTKEGFLMLPRKLDRKRVIAAIRADRDAQ